MSVFSRSLCWIFVVLLMIHVATAFFGPMKRGKCVAGDLINREAYVGWPIRISCRKMAYDYTNVAYDHFLARIPPPQHKITQCTITDKDTGTTIYDEAVRIWSWRNLGYKYPYKQMNDLTPKSSTHYKIELKTYLTCTYEDLTLHIKRVKKMTCQQANKVEDHAVYRVDVGSSDHVLDCEVNYYKDQLVTSLDPSIHDYKLTWYKDCELLKADNVSYTFEGNTLILGTVEYNMTGVYTCAITYNKMTRYGRIYDLCVRPPSRVLDPILNCPHVVKAKYGDTVVVSCTVTLTYTLTSWMKPQAAWRQLGRNQHICLEHQGKLVRRLHANTNCTSTFHPAQECFHEQPTLKQTESTITMEFTIENIGPNDVGDYITAFSISSQYVTANWRLETMGKEYPEEDIH